MKRNKKNKPITEKGYILLEPIQLEALFGNRLYFDTAVIIFHWLISELYDELGNQLDGIEIEVVRITYPNHRKAYPGLGIHYKNREIVSNKESSALVKLVEATIDRILQEKAVDKLIKFIVAEGIDWKELTDKIMTDERL